MTWNNSEEVHEMIGRFCVDFEQLCRSMEGCIRNIFYREGLTNDSIQEIILSGYTADPLRALLQSLVGETIVKNKKDLEICSKIFNAIQNLISERNDVLHGKWFLLDFTVEKGSSEITVLGEKLHSNKSGVQKKEFNLDKEKLLSLVDKCRECTIMLSLLVRCVLDFRNIQECFSIKQKNLVIEYQALKPVDGIV